MLASKRVRILAVFGLANAAEHDVRSALDAAREPRERTRELKSEIDLPPAPHGMGALPATPARPEFGLPPPVARLSAAAS